MVKFAEEKIENIYVEAYPLFVAHNEEVGVGLDLDINIDYYLDKNESGELRFYTLRDENELIGYAMYSLGYSINHKTRIIAREYGVYILKGRRGSGLEFVSFCEQELKKLRVKIVSQVVPVKSKWARLLEYKGYTKKEVMYQKEI